MEEQRRHRRARSLLLGGVIGASAALAAGRRGRPRRQKPAQSPAGLAAFEGAPCYRELVEAERLDGRAS